MLGMNIKDSMMLALITTTYLGDNNIWVNYFKKVFEGKCFSFKLKIDGNCFKILQMLERLPKIMG
jgi:hypothetical protein